MFHLFTIDGKRIDMPLERIDRNLKVGRIRKNYRARKYAGVEDREAEGLPGREGEDAGYGRDAYRTAVRGDSMRERVYQAREIMSAPVVSVDPGITAVEAWGRFDEHGFRNMPVLSREGALVGILSDRDLLKQLIITDGKVVDARDITVRDIMTGDVIATGPTTDIRRVARAMLEQHLGLMPVIDEGGGLLGVVTRSDILHAIIRHPGFSLWA